MAQTGAPKSIQTTVGPTFQQQAYIKASNTRESDKFGYSVAMSGNTLVIGAPNEDSNATGVNGDESNDLAGGSGAVYVFTRSDDTWTKQAYLKASNTGSSDQFGWSVAISGDTIAVGAYREASDATGINGDQSDNSLQFAGAAYVFTRSGTTWTQQAYIKASNTGFLDQFGSSIALSGETLVVGAERESSIATGIDGDQSDNSADRAGAAYIFTRDGSTWSQQAYVKASNTAVFDFFGYSVGISGDTVLIGAHSEDSNATGVNGNQANNTGPDSGAAYVFTRSGTTWTQQVYLKASNTGMGDQFGWSVAIEGDTAVVGARWERSNAVGVNGDGTDNNAVNSGAAYVFTRSDTTWSQQAYLKASNTETLDEFAYAAAISGDTLVIGSRLEGSNATGINGNQANNLALASGAVYMFSRTGTLWNQQAYMKASNTDAGDEFGFAVGISGDTIGVGAYLEDSNATVINGVQNNNDAEDSGAVFVFDLVSEFSVGGTLAGLAAGESVTLQNNGADDLIVNDNGSFVFPTPLIDGSDYAVTVVAPPACPNATCSISNGSGTLSGEDISNIRVQLRDEVHADSFEDPPEF